jgi:hypothetical protein
LPETPSPKYVFMSYSRTDEVVMQHVLKHLRKQGIHVWVDNEALLPGTPIWEVEIEKAIKSASAIVVICSPDANNSEWVRREITVAERYHKHIFPVLVRGDEVSSISIRLSTRQYVDIRENEDIGLASLGTAVNHCIEELERQEREDDERKTTEERARRTVELKAEREQEERERKKRAELAWAEKEVREKKKFEERDRITTEHEAQKEREGKERKEAEDTRTNKEGRSKSSSTLGRGNSVEEKFTRKPALLFSGIGGLAIVVLACLIFGGYYLFQNWLATIATPTQGAQEILTAAAQTVEANMTQSAILGQPTSTVGIPTYNLGKATTSVFPTHPPSTQSCDVAQFVEDVTIPDGTTLKPNETFTKTWRLKNVGTCLWTPSYAVAFSSGDSMNGQATQALAGNVNPGQTVDISVDLTAPGADGNYKGYWKLLNASKVPFAQFNVDIKVKMPTAALGPTTITLNATGGTEGGTVYEPAAGLAVVNGTILAGDTVSNYLARGYMSFDISSLGGKTVTAATLDLSACAQMQDPFGSLAGIWVGEVQYTLPLDQSDYDISGTGIQLLNALPNSSIDVKSYVQTRVTEGKSRFQIRLHPAGPSDGDGQADYMTCSASGPKLTITYQP